MKTFYRLSWLIVRGAFRVLYGFRTAGERRVPSHGPIILASNHRSYLDPPLIGVSLDREVHFVAKSELFSFGPFSRLISALNAHPIRRGQKDTAAVDHLIHLLNGGAAVVIFPEGTRTREYDGLGRPKSGVARLAQASRAPIQIVYVRGSRRKWRALLRHPPVSVHFGRRIEPEEYADHGTTAKGYRALARVVLDEIGKLMRDVEGEPRWEVDNGKKGG